MRRAVIAIVVIVDGLINAPISRILVLLEVADNDEISKRCETRRNRFLSSSRENTGLAFTRVEQHFSTRMS